MPPAPKDPTARVVAEILDGRHDGRIKEIAEALQKRQTDGHTRFIWRITLPDGETWDGRSATVAELAFAENATGIVWHALDPSHSMGHFAALVAGHYKAQGMTAEDAIKKAGELTEEQAEAAVSDYELVNPPKAPDSTTS